MDIISIENIVRNDTLSQRELMILYREYLKEIIRCRDNVTYDMDYDYQSNTSNTNCYAYGLGAVIPEWFVEKFDTGYEFYPGVLSSKDMPRTSSDVIEHTYEDLENLGLFYKSCDPLESTSDGVYKIAIYTENISFLLQMFGCNTDFHFKRQNIDGIWSEKLGFGRDICYSKKLKPIDGYDMSLVLKVSNDKKKLM